MKLNLPDKFQQSMKELLGAEMYPAFLASYERPVRAGIRVNTIKTTVKDFKEAVPFHLEPIPWIANGFYYAEEDMVSRHPLHFAGLYYMQEPSAMTPASLLPVEEGDLVLDLCAAPGGKATELGAKLRGKGFLLANDISNSRARALLRNLERFGIANMAVCSEDPRILKEAFPAVFDKILVDAPCSGEGMFHKEPQMAQFWEEHGPEYYSGIQKQLILQAADMLKPGGMMVYSTCTFSPAENEDILSWLIQNRPEFHPVKLSQRYAGFSDGLAPFTDAVRIFPQNMDGEGHFAALLQKEDAGQPSAPEVKTDISPAKIKLPPEAELFLRPIRQAGCFSADGNWMMLKEQLYYVPVQPVTSRRLRFLRTGLLVGECKKNRFEPSQALAMALKQEEFPLSISFAPSDERCVRYLKGETIDVPEMGTEKGWILVCTAGQPLGFGKLDRGRIKNKYSAGWRML